MKKINPDTQTQPIFVLAERYQKIKTPWHSHKRIQLLHVSSGVLTVVTRKTRFVVPPHKAVWIESDNEHRIESKSPFWLTTCYIEPKLLKHAELPKMVAITRLVDELLIAASNFGSDYKNDSPAARLVNVLLDSIVNLEPDDIALPEAKDKRLVKITDRLLNDPACNEPLITLAKNVGLTERTAARLFVKDTGMTFGRWRQQMRLLRSIEHLSQGDSVMRTATEVGYSDTSSFISAFKLLFGKTPYSLLRENTLNKKKTNPRL